MCTSLLLQNINDILLNCSLPIHLLLSGTYFELVLLLDLIGRMVFDSYLGGIHLTEMAISCYNLAEMHYWSGMIAFDYFLGEMHLSAMTVFDHFLDEPYLTETVTSDDYFLAEILS